MSLLSLCSRMKAASVSFDFFVLQGAQTRDVCVFVRYLLFKYLKFNE